MKSIFIGLAYALSLIIIFAGIVIGVLTIGEINALIIGSLVLSAFSMKVYFSGENK